MLSKYENFPGLTSPGCSSITEKFIDLPSTLAGVPVFILPDLKPKDSNCAVIPLIALSPILPPPNCLSPRCMLPFKNVPLFKTTALDLILMPIDVLTPTTLFFSTIISCTTSCQKSKFGTFSRVFLHVLLNIFLSHCALGLHIAGPFDLFKSLY